MFTSHHNVVTHAKRVVDHVKKHHHTYLFFGGLAGGVFLVAKIVMLFATSYMLYNASHDASFADDFVLTGDVQMTGIVLSTGDLQITGTVLSTGDLSSTGDTQTTGSIVSTGNLQTTGAVVSTGSEEYGFQTDFSSTCTYSGFSSNIISGKTYTGIMNLAWSIAPGCADEIVDIQLYDHNEEWITLARVPGTATGYAFDTKLLGSGFYTHTGIGSSGQTVILSLGMYSGIAMNFWTGYHLRWLVQPDTILSETPNFIIDNKKPTLANISLSSSGVSSGMIGVGMPLLFQFDASELLTGVIVTIGSNQATFSGLSGTRYTYRYLPTTLQSGFITYSISYKDLVGFTGYNTGISQLFYDSVYPQIAGYTISGYDFSFTTSELTRATSFVLLKNTTNGRAFSMTGTATGHKFSLPTLSLNTDYDMGIVVKDIAGNESKAALALKRTNSGAISYTLLATLIGQTLTTYSSGVTFLSVSGSVLSGTVVSTGVESIKQDFKEEIDKFAECRENIEYTKIKLQIKGTELILNMPAFKKSEIKKLINSFILYILKNLEKAPLSAAELQDIAQNFDSFSVILKLIKDDNNICKQNLSNYHLEQFKQSLETYGIEL